MSAILESLLTPQQRAQANAADAKARALAHYTAEAAKLEELHFCPVATDQSWSVKASRAEAIGDLDAFSDWLSSECMFHGATYSAGERVMRAPGRYAEAEAADVLCAALISAERSDADECLKAMREVMQRYLAKFADGIQQRAATFRAEAGE
jgi:hypothetical protein